MMNEEAVVEAVSKLERIFEVAPWLKDSDNSVHMRIDDPKITNYHKPLPHLSWCELYAMMLLLMRRQQEERRRDPGL